MTATFQVQGSIALITLDNPPINAMGLATRTAVADGLKRAQADKTVVAILITGAGTLFSGGADIREFNSPQALAEPNLHTLIDLVEQSSKPVIAAIHGNCVGGGLELALACHYRIAAADAQVALPEIKLGLLPGAGGTQRLPRAVGVEKALDMILSGAFVPAASLSRTALFADVAESDFMQRALTLAGAVADIRPLPKVRNVTLRQPSTPLFDAARAKAGDAALPAARKCIDAVEVAVTLPFNEGIALERKLFMELVQSTESRALRHAFFAERIATRIPDVPADTPRRTIRSAAVIGAGTMGSGIALTFINAGLPVTLLDTSQAAVDKGMAAIRRTLESTVQKGRLSPEKCAQRLALVRGSLRIDDIANADIVIEAVFESMAVKESVFRQLDQTMKPGAILASNTSTLDVNRIAGFTSRPHDVVGTHFFSPANVMKLLEIVRGRDTGKDTLATVLALAKTLRKTAVVASVCDGFIGNRMIEQYLRQAGFLLEEGCLPAQVDGAIERFGLAMGPFRMSDLAGNDIGWAIRKRRAVEKPDMTYSKTADLLCEMGRFGQKTGAGWYDYQAGDRTARPSDTVEAMVLRHASSLGIVRRAIADSEIVERLVYALVNEGARILEEGIAQRASDIDLVYLAGYGFPAWRGGPMFYADTVGLQQVVETMTRFAQGRHGQSWKPARLLLHLAEQGKTFNPSASA